MADVFVVTSGKGGVGKTTTAINLAVALREDGHPTAVLDADLGMPNVGEFLGLDPDVTLHQILSGRGSIEDAIVEVGAGLSVVTGDPDLGSFASADPNGLERVIDELAERYRYVVVDTGGGLSYEGIYPLELADGVILVTSPLPAAVSDTKKSKQLADRLGVPVRGVVVTHAVDGTDPESIAAGLGVDLLGSVPADSNVTESAIAHQSLLGYAPDSPSAAAYREVAATVAMGGKATGEPVEGEHETDVNDETTETESAAERPPEPETIYEDPTESGRAESEPAEAESAEDDSEATVPSAGTETVAKAEPAETDNADAEGSSTDAETESAEPDDSIDSDDAAVIGESGEDSEDESEDGERDGESADSPIAEDGEESTEESDDGESDDGSKPGFFSRLFGFK